MKFNSMRSNNKVKEYLRFVEKEMLKSDN